MKRTKKSLLKMTLVVGLGLLIFSILLACETVEKANVQTVQKMYERFGQGDLPGVLDLMTDDIEWIIPGPPEAMAGAGIYHGPEEVAQFFAKLGDAIEFEQFEPQEFIAQGDKVVVLGHSRETVKATNQTVEFDWAGVYTIRGGKVAAYHIYEPTHKLVDANRAR